MSLSSEPGSSLHSSSSHGNSSKHPRSVIIRDAQASDVTKLAETIVSSFYNDLGFFFWVNPLLQFTVAEDLRYRLNNHPPLYRCLAATIIDRQEAGQQKAIAGTVEIAVKQSFWLAKTNHAQYPYISNLAVKADFRRQGIAKKLLSKCEQIAQNWGYDTIQLHVLADNQQAKQLYLNFGYNIIAQESHWNGFFQPFAIRLLLQKTIKDS